MKPPKRDCIGDWMFGPCREVGPISSVAIYRDAEIVGHVPYNLAPRMSAFFMRVMNKAFAEITGASKVNRGTVYMDLTFMLTK